MLRRQDPRWAYLLVNLATLIWASNITLGRVLRNDIAPSILGAARFTIAAVIFLALWLKSQPSPLNRRPASEPRRIRQASLHWIWPLGMALCGVFGFTILLYLALRYTTASHAALINAISPLVTALMAALLLKERFTLPLVAGSGLSLVGVGLVIGISPGNPGESGQMLIGDLLCLLAAIIWGMYSVFSRLATRTSSSLQASATSIWMALPLLYISALAEWQASPPTLTLPVLLAVLYIGVFPSVIGYLAWNEGVLRVGPNQAMAFYNTLPVYGALLGVLVLGESLSWGLLLGGGMVIAGALIVAKSRA
jgi:drug/metabolite transporter (DMT)-like permease